MQSRLSFTVIRMLSLAIWLFLPLVAQAQDPTSLDAGIDAVASKAPDFGLSQKESILPVLTDIVEELLAISAVLAMGALVWGGIMYIMSLGNESRAETAKKIILYAIIGVIVILLSLVIIQFIQAQLVEASA